MTSSLRVHLLETKRAACACRSCTCATLLACLLSSLLHRTHALDLREEHPSCDRFLVILFKVDARVVEGLVKLACIHLAPSVRPLALCAPPFILLLLQVCEHDRHRNGGGGASFSA